MRQQEVDAISRIQRMKLNVSVFHMELLVKVTCELITRELSTRQVIK